jgi:LmbE family N-acetylglucosaminyl deacetylase
MNILVIAAHPDDEILGLGGTLLKHTANGDKVYIHILTDGHSSRKRENDNIEKSVKKRLSCAEKAADTLGAAALHFSDFLDQKLDAVPIIKIIHEIESFAAKINPDYVYTHHTGDVNYDHKVTFQAVINAFRPASNIFPVKLFSFETISASEWGLPASESLFNPNYYVDISAFLKKKLELIKCYEDELKEYPHPRSLKGIELIAQRWGTVIHSEAAEAFILLRGIDK